MGIGKRNLQNSRFLFYITGKCSYDIKKPSGKTGYTLSTEGNHCLAVEKDKKRNKTG